jgi:ankyrin repeat protein
MTQAQINNIINQRYQIVRVLGNGGIGITYEAQDLETGSHIALKAISLKQLTNAKQLELLEREVEVLKKLNHPSIPSYLDYFEVDSDTDRVFYIVQQLAPGKNLEQWVKQGWQVTEKEVKKIAEQILDILTYLHNLNPPVIHRDIKPHNLIRSEDGKVFLVDFGAVQNAYYTTLTRGDTAVGTFGYMPLEQANGKAVSASDLYSLGATLLYLLTRRSPHELSKGLSFDVRSHLKLSEGFAEWLEKILEPDVDERFSSPQEALNALKKPQLVREGKLSKGRWLAWLGLGAATVAGVTFFYNYKWSILNRLGFRAPVEVCRQEQITVEYFRSGGKLSQSDAHKCVLWANSGALHWAAAEGHEDVAEALIAHGADVNLKDNDGDTPLHKVTSRGHKEIVELLIAHGADVNAQNNDGHTPLHHPPVEGDKDVVELLIARGANLNDPDNDGDTPLHHAASKGHKEIVELLIAYGADLNAQDNDGDTPLHEVASRGHKEMVELLITQGADVNVKDNDHSTPLYEAAFRGYKDITELLIAHGADVNHKNIIDNTPLDLAAFKGHKEIVELLIAHGADVNQKNPLQIAASGGHKEIVELLIAHGADVNQKNVIGLTPLHATAYGGDKEIVELLIAHGANVNVKDKDGLTPLHVATMSGHKEIVELLKKHGAK